MSDSTAASARADYGIDAPQVVLWLLVSGIVAVVVGVLTGWWLARPAPQIAIPILITGLMSGIPCVLTALLMVFGSKALKLRLRDKVLDSLSLEPRGEVLDVGCGRGLLLIGAAHRVPQGKAVGIDLWQREDQSGNRLEQTMANAEAEGVADRVAVETGDMRDLPFRSESFDAVVSSWAVHNVYDAQGREKAIREMVRVLRPSGRVAIVDIRHTSEYMGTLMDGGMTDVRCSRPYFLFLVPSRVVTARKTRNAEPASVSPMSDRRPGSADGR